MNNLKSYRLRLLAMLAVLAIVAVGYFTTTGIGNTCGFGWGDITLLCPLGALMSMLATKTAIPAAILSVMGALIICLVLGKVFCAWVCPVHFLSPAKKSRHGRKRLCTAAACATCAASCRKRTGVHLDSRHAILAGALITSLIFGYPVFCLACPVGLSFATVLLVMQLFAFGKTTWTIIVFPAIVFVELFILPRWCHNLCPLGALLSLFSVGNKTFRPTIDADACMQTSEGKSCNLCAEVCPEGINLHDSALGRTTLNDCSKCRACADACPRHAITFPLLATKGGPTAKGDAGDAGSHGRALDAEAGEDLQA